MVKEVFEDYLRCHAYYGLTQEEVGSVTPEEGEEPPTPEEVAQAEEEEGIIDIYVAKDPALRNSITAANITGIDYFYTYAEGDDVYNVIRTSNDGDTTEDQVVTPPWIPDEIIIAIRMNKTGVTRTLDDKRLEDITEDDALYPVKWIYFSPNRQWAGPKEEA